MFKLNPWSAGIDSGEPTLDARIMTSKVDAPTERVYYTIYNGRNIGIEMKRREVTKTFKMITNWKRLWSRGLYKKYFSALRVNPLTAKLFNLRGTQLQVSENYSDLTKWRSTLFKSCLLMSHFIFNLFKMW